MFSANHFAKFNNFQLFSEKGLTKLDLSAIMIKLSGKMAELV